MTPTDLDQFDNRLENFKLELQSLREEFVQLTGNRDQLTGARNRSSLLPYLREQQALVRREVQQCGLVMLDLDLFKAVNDRHGHLAGDAVLASTGTCLLTNIRPYDVIFRYGGEEFLVCMPQTTVNEAASLAERLRSVTAAQRIPVQDSSIQVSASFGVATLESLQPVEVSIEHADKALYQAKLAGRNCVAVWDEASSDSAP